VIVTVSPPFCFPSRHIEDLTTTIQNASGDQVIEPGAARREDQP